MGVELTSGTRIRGYTVLEPIGRGGFGDVYKARTREKAVVALKQFRLAVSRDSRPADVLRMEGLVSLVGLRCPHVCEVLEVFVHEELQYVAMEFVEGEPLDAVVARNGPCSLRCVRLLAPQLLAGLGFLHGHRVVHRDVKPSNVILSVRKGGAFVAKLIDLDTLVCLDRPRVTSRSEAIASREYAPVEVILGGESVIDNRADVYAFGATLFHALTGGPPFGEAVTEGFFRRLVAPERPSIRTCRPELPDALDGAIQQFMALRAEDRPNSVEEVWSRLDPVLPDDGKPLPKLPERAESTKPEPLASLRPCISVMAGPLAGRTIPVPREGIALGRPSLNPEDRAIGRIHLRAIPTRRGLLLKDLGSRNGLVVGHRRLRRVLLHPGEEVRIGGTILKRTE